MDNDYYKKLSAIVDTATVTFDDLFADLERPGPSIFPPPAPEETDFKAMKDGLSTPADKKVIDDFQQIWERYHVTAVSTRPSALENPASGDAIPAIRKTA